ncbi:hypothetical protein A2U01_0096645, partial [Trifolium medium]|nr:hypothetical protein [Trifolium medium]
MSPPTATVVLRAAPPSYLRLMYSKKHRDFPFCLLPPSSF